LALLGESLKSEVKRETPVLTFPALDSGGSRDGIVQTSQPGFFFPPVVTRSGPKGSKFMFVP